MTHIIVAVMNGQAKSLQRSYVTDGRVTDLKKSWWNWVAKEVKRQPRAVTRPASTAVTLVDLRRQNAMVTGEMKRATPVDIAPSHPKKKEKRN